MTKQIMDERMSPRKNNTASLQQSLNEHQASGSTCSSAKSYLPITGMINSGSPSKITVPSKILPSHHSSVPCNKTMNTITNDNNSTSTMRNFGESFENIDGNRSVSTWPSSLSNEFENKQ